MPTLEILSGNSSGLTVPFSEEAKVGKDPKCEVPLADPGISRVHATITQAGGAFQIEDQGSSNGTYVNFKKRSKGEKTSLSDKDILFFGRTVAKFWAGAPPPSARPGARIHSRPASADQPRPTASTATVVRSLAPSTYSVATLPSSHHSTAPPTPAAQPTRRSGCPAQALSPSQEGAGILSNCQASGA